MFDPDEIRKDFPIFNRTINGKKLVYFDNAATTQKPVQVIKVIEEFYSKHNANIHRGLHTLSQEASQMYEEAHEIIAKFVNAKSWREIVFVNNTTEAINTVAYGWALWNLQEGDEIVVTIMDHHSNILPWRLIAQLKKAKVIYVDVTSDGYLRYDQLAELVTPRTRIVAFPIASNVLGTVNDARKIARIAHEVGAIAVADGAQSVPHMPTNVKELEVDFLAFSGHKMLGPTGIGVLWGREDILEEMKPFKVGGDTIKDVTVDYVVWHDLPWRFEAGTPNIAGGIGLAEAAKYLMRIGMENVREHEKSLVAYTLKRFEELLGELEYYGPKNPEDKTAVIAFNIKGLNHHTVGMALDLFGIAVRTGMHCAHPLHYRLGLAGTVRSSYYIYNTHEEVDYFIEALEKIIQLKESLSKEKPSIICPGT
ncbi:MAG: SufS family cysteine desulfurase [Desulfurococcaceae archaeon]